MFNGSTLVIDKYRQIIEEVGLDRAKKMFLGEKEMYKKSFIPKKIKLEAEIAFNAAFRTLWGK